MYDDFGNLVRAAEEPPKLDDPKSASSQLKKTLKFITPLVPVGTEGEVAAKTESASQRPRRSNAGKRKLDDTSLEHTAPTDSKRQKPDGRKPARKPREKTPIPIVVVEDTEAGTVSVSSPGTELSNPPPANFPPTATQHGGNINPSIDMAWHRGMTNLLEKHISETMQKWEMLQSTIIEAEKQWEEVQKSMQATKSFMNEWTSRWTMSDAFTL